MFRTPLLHLTAVIALAVVPAAAPAQRDPPPLPPGLKPDAPPAEPGRRDPPPLPPELEVQGRGPVHEAFAEPGTPPSAAPVVPKQPPAPIEELPPEQKPDGEGVQWIPGYWQWDEERNDYLWVSGCWRVPPPDKVWLPGRWHRVSGGWQRVSGSWVDAERSEVELLPPPPPPKEEDVPRLAAGQVYEPGCWVYRQNRYVWRPGFAVTEPRGWVWVSARYAWTPAGCIFVEGHWDYPLRDRGLLFAPVAFAGGVKQTTAYVPRHVVREECLLGALFVRPADHHYYFGDYFEKRYERGYVPWTRYRLTGAAFDSLFGYYRQYGERGWEQSIQELYAARYGGKAPRPPRTFAEQETFVRQATVRRTLTVEQVQQAAVLAPLAQYEGSGYKLEKLHQKEFSAYRQSAVALAQFGQQFEQREFQVFSDQRGAQRFTGGPVVVKWDKGHPHGVPPGLLKKFGAPPPFPDLPFDDGPKKGKPKKEKK